ncbi:LysR family transcriptional regulator [Planctobacterium marinum]|uniref:LysR family transcriptional regulator n=1 Tax=Planctobacterium marinum TaxID=1631968 RepID=UPI001E2DF91E|nr:LysR family transcriptional regulator [Planctobacterium marinum]MCC2606918.1 LysR family transcriptional regulator [Planctobacterium marinum]
MVRLEDLTLFVRAAALGSFSNVAREVDILPAQVSVAIKRLEKTLGIRLFARSTRSLRLTAEGEEYLTYAQKALETLQEGHERINHQDSELSGTLQVAAPSDLGRNMLVDWFSEFRVRHPNINLKLHLSDQVTNVFREPVDVAIRYGVMNDASFVALPLAPENRRVLVASPEYIKRHGRPEYPDELQQHNCLTYLLKGRIHNRWRFGISGHDQTIEVSGDLQCDDADVIRRWAIAGEGLAYKSWLDVSGDILAGRLEILLPQLQGEPAPLHLICPHRKQFSPAIRQVHHLLREHCTKLMQDFPRVEPGTKV